MKFRNQILAFTVISFSLIAMTACETSDQNNLAQATACVNNAAKLSVTDQNAAATSAAQCERITAALTSPDAAKVGFSAVLLMAGKFSQLTNLVTALKGSSNTLATGFTFLVFPSNITDSNYSKMRDYATRSGSAGIMTVWSIFQMANAVANLGGLTSTPTLANVTSAIAALTPANANTPGSVENTLATAALTAQQTACSGSGSTSTTCTKITQAIGTNTSSPSAILAALQAFAAAGG